MNKKIMLYRIVGVSAVVYCLLGISFRSFHPCNIYHRSTGTALTISESRVSKYFNKYAMDWDIVLSWKEVDSKERPKMKWDSTWIYGLKITGINNMASRVNFDSLNIIDVKSNTVIFKITDLRRSCESKKEFSLAIDIKDGQMFPIVFLPDHHDVVADSLAEHRYNNKLFGVQLFTSVGGVSLIPKEYIVLQ